MAKIRFKRLGLFYLLALGCIAFSIFISQVLIQTSINNQQDDARAINVAGRQRMLSQKISKVALKIQSSEEIIKEDLEELGFALNLWTRSHEGLQNGDTGIGIFHQPSENIKKMFADIEPHYLTIRVNAENILNPSLTTAQRKIYVSNILAHEKAFLEGMDKIVFEYDNEAQEKVKDLKRKELYLFIVSIVIILFELLFVFTPMARSIRATVNELTDSEKASQNMTREISKLYDELGKSYQDLEAVNVKPESPSVYAKINADGTFNFVSSTFLSLMEYDEQEPPDTLQKLLKLSEYRDDFINGLMEILKNGKNWTGELRLINEPGDFVWLQTNFIPTLTGGEIKLIATDITEFKEAKMRSRELNKERIEKSVKEQQYRSALILQGQEEERKRLSREIHDGVGQMLSAMKMLLESLPATSGPIQMKINDAKSLMKSIIQEVRRVSFNLTPSSLDDFGLVPAVNKFCEEINAVSKSEITFINQTRFINRLESNIETNLYRIIQEAVNNALKYAKAEKITVTFSHSINSLHIIIEDNGKGFDLNRVQSSGHFEKAGHGIFNMKERTSYIGGTFNIDSQVGEGTKILITLSLDKND